MHVDRPVSVSLHRIELPLRRPLRSAHGEELRRVAILVEFTPSDGPSGWGECSALMRPTYTAEYVDGAWSVLRDHLVPEVLQGEVSAVRGHPMATAALTAASADATLRRLGRPLVESVAARLGPWRPTVARTAVLGLGSGSDVLDAVDDAIGAGAAAVKVKVSSDPDTITAVESIRAARPDLPLAVDGNGRLDRRALARLDDLGLLYVEQPAPADDPVLSARWARTCRTPFALDESIDAPGAVDVAAALGAGAIVNVKPARLGGMEAAIETIQRADDHGMAVFVGGMIETGVGRAWALALAASRRCQLPTDLGPSGAYVDHDVVVPSITTDEHGQLLVPVGAGLGVDIDTTRLHEVRTEHLVLG